MWGEENFLKEAFLPPTPPNFQELSNESFILVYIVRSSTMFAQNDSVGVGALDDPFFIFMSS